LRVKMAQLSNKARRIKQAALCKVSIKGRLLMRDVTFTESDLQAIQLERYYHPDPQVQRKMEVLWLKHNGITHAQIATLAGVSRRSVQRYLAEFLQGGLAEIRRNRHQGKTSELARHSASLEEYFQQHPPRSLKEARAVIEQRTGIRRGLTQVRHFLHRLNLKPRKVAAIPIPPKKTLEEHVQEQGEFLDEKLEPVLQEARQGRRKVFFVDASHFVFATLLGYVWCAVRWCVRAASGRKRFNVLGAVDAVSHEMIRVTNHSYINALSVCELLKAIAQVCGGCPVTVVLDNARYQKCDLVQNLAKQLGIELLYLPSYSPNLNLIERVWKFVKKECLQSKYHANYDEFTTAISQCLDDLGTKHKAAMRSLLTHEFQTFEHVSVCAA
jgi:transposase